MNRIPKLSAKPKHKICIICEGSEEFDYLVRLNDLGVWSSQYEITLDNADGNGNIPARYQDKYQNGTYEIVLIFCDTEKKPYEQYIDIRQKINEFHGVDNAADEVIIFTNPCIMQIIIKHWEDIKIKTAAKKVNAPLIEKYTGVANYKARKDQRKKIMEFITEENYVFMRECLDRMSNTDTEIGSSNFGKFIEYFSDENYEWIETINNKLESGI